MNNDKFTWNHPENTHSEPSEKSFEEHVNAELDRLEKNQETPRSDDRENQGQIEENRAKTLSQTAELNANNPSQGKMSTELMITPAAQSSFDEAEFEREEKGLLGGYLLFTLIIIFTLAAFYWASTAALDKQVRAEGNVIPPSDVQIVQSILPGVVTEINVELGSSVAEGDVLFRMEDKQVQSEFSDNEIIIRSNSIAATRLQAEAENRASVVFSPDLIAEAPLEVQREQTLFIQQKQALEAEIEILQAEAETFKQDIAEKQAVARSAELLAQSLAEEFELIKPLVDAGHEPRVKLIDINRRLAQAKGDAEIAERAIGTSTAKLAASEKRIETELKKYVARASAELIRVQTTLAQAQSRQEVLAGRVGYAEVKSPHNGVISALHLKTVGAVVNQGSLLAEIVPTQSEMLVRAKLKPQDIADVAIGQRVKVSLSAYDVSRYGSLEGIVIKIATNTTEEANLAPYYETFISIPNPVFSISQIKAEAIPGMQVTVGILGGKRTVLDYLLSPIQRASEVAFREI